VTLIRYLGVDPAWRGDRVDLPTNETGVAATDSDRQVLYAGSNPGVQETIAWANSAARGGDAFMFVDAPLVVRNETGQRLCEPQVGQRARTRLKEGCVFAQRCHRQE
jgi:predicted RNase H-like nuclease